MRNIFVVLGFIASILALILAVTPLFKIAYIPAIVALIFGLIAFFIAKQKEAPRKSIQLVFLLTVISLSLSTYKTIFTKAEVGNTEALIEKENESELEALEDLEGIEIDE